jgi:hypothetical protein
VSAQGEFDRTAHLGRDAAVLRDRGRQDLHPGTPLELKGNEQGSHRFRGNTPGLEHSTNRATRVDAELNYARRIAMYDQGKVYHAALPGAPIPPAMRKGASRTGNGEYGSDVAGAQGNEDAQDKIANDPSSESAYRFAWYALAGLALAVSIFRVRRKQAGTTQRANA